MFFCTISRPSLGNFDTTMRKYNPTDTRVALPSMQLGSGNTYIICVDL